MNILRNNFKNLFINKCNKFFTTTTKNTTNTTTTTNKNTTTNTTTNNNIVLYCDGGYNNLTKPYAWSSVVDSQGFDVITTNLNLINNLLKNNFEYLNVKIPHLTTKKLYNRTIIKVKFTNIIQQNNGAELIGMLVALFIVNNTKSNSNYSSNVIYTDSQTIINWCIGKCNLKSGQKDKNNNDKLYYINLLQQQYNIFLQTGKIIKINGNKNLADLGKHKNN